MSRVELYTFTLPCENHSWDTDEVFFNYIISLIHKNCDDEYLSTIDEEQWKQDLFKLLEDDEEEIFDIVYNALEENYENCESVEDFKIEFNDAGNDYIVSQAVMYKY